MEYVQMTLDDWLRMKQELKRELLGVRQSFVRIGYMLRQIEDQKLYEQDGYKSTAEFALKELGLGASTVTRFMQINREYSEGGYSKILAAEYRDFNRSLLEEMLKLPAEDRAMIEPGTSRESVRELKHFEKEEPKEGEADDIRELIEQFYRENRDILNRLYQEGIKDRLEDGATDGLIEIVNPGGNRSFRKGLFFVMMYEDNIKVKKFGENPRTMTWKEFFRATVEIYGDYVPDETGAEQKEDAVEETEKFAPAQNPQTLGNPRCKGQSDNAEQKKEKPERKERESLSKPEKSLSKPEKSDQNHEKSVQKEEYLAAGNYEEEPEEIAPAQNPGEPGNPGSGEDFNDVSDDVGENCEKGFEENPEGQQEVVGRIYQSRDKYYSSLDGDAKSRYMASVMSGMMGWIEEKGIRIITTEEFWEMLWDAEVDGAGREIEEA